MDPTLGSIVTAAIAAISAIVVGVINNNAQMTKIRDEQRSTLDKFTAETGKAMALTDERIKNLTEEVKKHNSIVERMYKLEQEQAIIKNEVEELKKDVR